jgi:AraC family ethanolamine operon transcriptional activator
MSSAITIAAGGATPISRRPEPAMTGAAAEGSIADQRKPRDLTSHAPTPPAVMFSRFSEPEEYVASLSLASARFQTRLTSAYSATVMRADFGGITFGQGDASMAATVHGQISDRCVFILDTIPGPDRVLGGRVAPFGTLYHPASNDSYVSRSTNAVSEWLSLSIPYHEIAAFTAALTGRDLTPPRSDALYARTPEPALQRLIRLSGRIRRITEHDATRLTRPAAKRALSGLIGQALTACLLDGRLEPDLAAAGRHRRIMARLEEIGETNVHAPLTLAELCAALGVNARTLRLITHEYVGMGPTQYLRMHRLNRVRRALAVADPRRASIGDIAAEYGFWESGRFAAFYRATFGEAPTATLRRA